MGEREREREREREISIVCRVLYTVFPLFVTWLPTKKYVMILPVINNFMHFINEFF